jgi:hypothetical protein
MFKHFIQTYALKYHFNNNGDPQRERERERERELAKTFKLRF